jgi:hypothetical protein
MKPPGIVTTTAPRLRSPTFHQQSPTKKRRRPRRTPPFIRTLTKGGNGNKRRSVGKSGGARGVPPLFHAPAKGAHCSGKAHETSPGYLEKRWHQGGEAPPPLSRPALGGKRRISPGGGTWPGPGEFESGDAREEKHHRFVARPQGGVRELQFAQRHPGGRAAARLRSYREEVA